MTADVSKVNAFAVVGMDNDLGLVSKLNAFAVVGMDNDLGLVSKLNVFAVVGPIVRIPVINITN